MRVITEKRLLEYGDRYPDCRNALHAWCQVARKARWRHLADVRQTYRQADSVGDKTVFNIKGNSYRLITKIDYKKEIIYIREFLSHAEYDKDKWKR